MNSYHKKRQGGYYNQNIVKKKRNFVLEPGLKGFICTCNNNREKDCVREAYNVLNMYSEILYQSEGECKPADGTPGNDEAQTSVQKTAPEEEEEDIDVALSKELHNLKQEHKKEHKFQVVESGASNYLFIKTTLPEPTELAHFIMEDIHKTKKQRSRFLLRLVPVEATCKAYMDEIQKCAAGLFDKYFSKEGKTFAIVFGHRNNNSISRNTVIEELAEMIKFRHVDNKVDLNQPQLTVVVEVIRSMCCLGIVPDYFNFLKYNLLELCGKGEKAAREAQNAAKTEEKKKECETGSGDPDPNETASPEESEDIGDKNLKESTEQKENSEQKSHIEVQGIDDTSAPPSSEGKHLGNTEEDATKRNAQAENIKKNESECRQNAENVNSEESQGCEKQSGTDAKEINADT